MMFTFKRNAEEIETIHVDDMRVAVIFRGGQGATHISMCREPPMGVDMQRLEEAARKADSAGFWQRWPSMGGPGDYRRSLVRVEVTSC